MYFAARQLLIQEVEADLARRIPWRWHSAATRTFAAKCIVAVMSDGFVICVLLMIEQDKKSQP